MAIALKILLVEDSAIDAELAAYELAKLGMAVEWNRVSTEEALRQALLEFCPSVILSDHSMPAFDRLSALHIASEMTPEIPCAHRAPPRVGHHESQAITSRARLAHYRGDRTARLRGEHLVRLHGAGQNAEADHRPPASGDHLDHPVARCS
jgi:CheY-like chemotaxis protein